MDTLPNNDTAGVGESDSDAIEAASTRFFEVKLDLFDGPIDLLLHLVKKRELPIEKVSLAEVTGQYLECIKSLKYYDVEVAAEYLVIAATLLSVKASVLLNDPVELVPDANGELVDPHEELVRRLQELEAFRAAAIHLSNVPKLGIDVFAPPTRGVKVDPLSVPLADHDSQLLVTAFQRVLSGLGERSRTMDISIDSVSIVDRMRTVIDRLKSATGPVTFMSLLAGVVDRATAVGTFVALLELCRRRMISVSQGEIYGDIQVSLSLVGKDELAGDLANLDERAVTAVEVAA